MARRRRGGKKKKDLIFLLGAVLLIAFIWGAFEATDEPEDITPPDPDSDDDGLQDEWERQYFGNLDQTAEGDFDNDGLTNKQEHDDETDPTVKAPPPPPTNISISIMVFNVQTNYTYTLSLTVDGVSIPMELLSRPQQAMGKFEVLPGNHTINFTSDNDTKPLYLEKTVELSTDGWYLILEISEDELFMYASETIPVKASCSA